MIPGRLLQKLDAHWADLTQHIVRHIRADQSLPRLNERMTDSEIRMQAESIQVNLHRWIADPDGPDLARHYEAVGRVRCAEGVPLHESIRGIQVVKRKMVEYVRDQNILQTAMDIYAEEEFEHDVDRFFDDAVYELAKGYEAALRHSPMAAQAR